MTINFLNIIQVLITMAMIGFILVQRGPGATAGSAFGSGASGTVFGAKGTSSFLTKATAVLATLFFIITMAISINAKNVYGTEAKVTDQNLGVMGTLDNKEQPAALIPGDDLDTTLLKPVIEPSTSAPQNTTEIEVKQPELSAEPELKTDNEQAIDEDQGGNE